MARMQFRFSIQPVCLFVFTVLLARGATSAPVMPCDGAGYALDRAAAPAAYTLIRPVDASPAALDLLARARALHNLPAPNGVINPPAWTATNTLTNTFLTVIPEPRGSVYSSTGTMVVVLYAVTNALGVTDLWIDLSVYPHTVTIADRRGRTPVRDVLPAGAGSCFWANGYDGKFLLLTKKLGGTHSMLLYRVTRRGLKLMGERAIDGLSAPRLFRGKVITTPTIVDLTARTQTSAIECYNRRLSKLIWSRPFAPGAYVHAMVGARSLPAFPNGVTCQGNWAANIYSWTISKQDKAVCTHSVPAAPGTIVRLMFDAHGGAVFWSNSGTPEAPTNASPAYVSRKGVRPLTFPSLGSVGWACDTYDGKYFMPHTMDNPSIVRSYLMRHTPRLRGERTISDFNAMWLDGSRVYIVTSDGTAFGAVCSTTVLKKDRWSVPSGAGRLSYLGRGVMLRELANETVSPMRFTTTLITRRGTLAEHTFTY
jgi:hypothetical protein